MELRVLIQQKIAQKIAPLCALKKTALIITISATTALVPVFSAIAQTAPKPAPPKPVAVPATPASAGRVAAPIPPGTVRAINVTGNERLEPETVRSYIGLIPGDKYDVQIIDEGIKRLYATELFADVTIRVDNEVLTVAVRENPVLNRIITEGNKRIKDEDLDKEIKLAPRQIYTRSKVRADVARIIELYRRKGRFAATVDPKVVQLPQNRVDLVYEINEGPKSKVRQINIIGNTKYSDGELRSVMFTRQSRWFRLFTSNDTYDPDRATADGQKLRQFYLTEGYADFRVTSQVAELTPDRKDFIMTFVVEEGERYKFGKVDLTSEIKDLKPEGYKALLPMKEGEWYNAKQIDDTIELLTNTAGLFGYAFADVNPKIKRNKDTRTMDITFKVEDAPRVYVERIDINGNTRTEDQVIRREFRLAEGDAFNSFKVKRSKERIQGLGYFQEKLEVEQKPGSAPDKVVLEVNVEEKSTGQLSLGAGFSSLESFIFNLGLAERNFLGKGYDLRSNFELSSFRNQIDIGFTNPYFLGRNLSAGIDVFRRDANDANFGQLGSAASRRDLEFSQLDTGFQLRVGFPVTEYWSYGLNYGLSQTNVTSRVAGTSSGFAAAPGFAGQFVCQQVTSTYDDLNGNGIQDAGEPIVPLAFDASPFLCDTFGKRTTSALGHSIAYNSLNNSARPSSGQRFVFSQSLAGLGGSVNYLRTTANYDAFFPFDLGKLGSNWVLRLGAQGGHIAKLGGTQGIRLTDRFNLGTPQFRGFSFRGIGPRDCAYFDQTNACELTGSGQNNSRGLGLGGNVYYKGTAELEVPLGAAASELGLRASAFLDVGALWKLDFGNEIRNARTTVRDANGNITASTPLDFARIGGNTAKPRVSVGIGVSWNSPFGPFRIDISKALRKDPADETEVFQFNVGTSF
jgi:outer membrane protein insertion porin family